MRLPGFLPAAAIEGCFAERCDEATACTIWTARDGGDRLGARLLDELRSTLCFPTLADAGATLRRIGGEVPSGQPVGIGAGPGPDGRPSQDADSLWLLALIPPPGEQLTATLRVLTGSHRRSEPIAAGRRRTSMNVVRQFAFGGPDVMMVDPRESSTLLPPSRPAWLLEAKLTVIP